MPICQKEKDTQKFQIGTETYTPTRRITLLIWKILKKGAAVTADKSLYGNLIIGSIHPDTFPEDKKDAFRDPIKYTELIVSAIEKNPQMNIIGHIGWNCPDLDIEALDWKRIGEAALKHHVAIEVNLYDFLKYNVYGKGGILDLKTYPENDTTWRDDFAKKVHKNNLMVFSPAIRNALKPLVAQGLKFAINADEHILPPEAGKWMPDQKFANPEELPFRFWRALKIVEKEFNLGFMLMGATKDSIINTYSVEKLRNFLEKS